jgi:hypothetical protein
MSAAALKSKNILELDQIVSDYLIFRKCNQASEALLLQRDFFSEECSDSSRNPVVSSRILAAFDSGDYASLLSLWETYIVQFSSGILSESLTYEIKAAEFLCNLHCAIYPFRSEIIRGYGEIIMRSQFTVLL